MLLFYSIFQLAETNDPGTFKVWAVVGTDLHTIKVNVPRIFYVNCHTPKEGAGTSKFSVFHFSHNFSYGFNHNSNKTVSPTMWTLHV